MSRKKIILLTTIILAVLLVIFLIFSGVGKNDGEGIFGNLFPIGGEEEIPFPTTDTNGGLGSTTTQKSALIQITSRPVSSFGFSSTTIKYVDRETGNIFESSLDGTNNKRISNNTILGSFGGEWSFDGLGVVVQYIDSSDDEEFLKNFSLDLSSITSANIEARGTYFSLKSSEIVASPSEQKVFYLLEGGNETLGIVSGFDGKNQKQIFKLDFNEFALTWPNKNTITLTTKPSSKIEGFLYFLGADTGALKKIIGNVRGLITKTSPDLKNIIFSESPGKTVKTKFYSFETKSSQDLPIKTLADKCIWSKKDSAVAFCGVPSQLPVVYYPDDWYQGAVFFNDSWWQVNIADNTANKIIDSDLDVLSPAVSADGRYVAFINKKDLSLWSLDLEVK